MIPSGGRLMFIVCRKLVARKRAISYNRMMNRNITAQELDLFAKTIVLTLSGSSDVLVSSRFILARNVIRQISGLTLYEY